MHVLEAGFGAVGRACVVLLHGFPKLAYSWRKAMPAVWRCIQPCSPSIHQAEAEFFP
jgi:hypothetical protein